MKLWFVFFVLWLALCGTAWVWLHPGASLPFFTPEVSEAPMGILPGDLPGYDAPPPAEIIPVETH